MKKFLMKKRKNREPNKTVETETFEVKQNMPELVYGPPSFFEQRKIKDYNPVDNRTDPVYGPPSVLQREAMKKELADKNIVEGVYGPPQVFDSPIFSAESNEPEDVYGPPPAFTIPEEDPDTGKTVCPCCGSEVAAGDAFCGTCGFNLRDRNIPAPLYGPPPEEIPVFAEDRNVPDLVYGPPSVFGFDDDEC